MIFNFSFSKVMVERDLKGLEYKKSFETWSMYGHRVDVFIQKMLFGKYYLWNE